MKLTILPFVCFFATIAGILCSRDIVLISGSELSLRDQGPGSFSRPAGRSLLFFEPKQEVELVAALNGTVYLIDSDSRKVLWSFSSGPPIHSSYHTPVNQEDKKDQAVVSSYSYADCGDDWELYLNTHYGKLKIGCSMQDFINRTPLLSEDGGIILGSRHATVLKVDPWTGRLISNYTHSGSSNRSQFGGKTDPVASKENIAGLEKSSSMDLKSSSVELCIKRIDYSLQSFASNSNELWNLTIAFFEAGVQCRGGNSLSDGASSGSVDELGSNYDSQMSIPSPCLLEFVVRRFRSETAFESFLKFHRTLEADRASEITPLLNQADSFSASHHKAVSSSAQNHMHPSLPKYLDFLGSSDSGKAVPRPPLELKNNKFQTSRNQAFYGLGMLAKAYIPWFAVFMVLLRMGYIAYCNAQIAREKFAQFLPFKRNRTRRSGKSIGSVEEGQYIESDDKKWLNPGSLVDSCRNGGVIGKLFISNTEIAKGSNGTVIFDGIYDGRKVAVKRLLQAHHDVAIKEIQNLIAADQHPNIVRLYGVECDKDFLYISLERCICSLSDLIQLHTNSPHNIMFANLATNASTEHKAKLNSLRATMQDIALWKGNGYPSPLLIKLMRDVVSGLVHLHELGIIHRDIKPQNVLITKERTLCAKLSDMGISKRLLADMSSLGLLATGCGTSGWQAPEQLLHGHQTRAVDMFSLGCLFFFCVTGGGHPFGDWFERDANIINNQRDLFLVEHIPEALQLFSNLLHLDPEMRPKAFEVLHHPFFWDSEMRLSFLRDASDRVELETNSDILNALESVGPLALGAKWNEKMEPAFINNIGRYRRYKYDSVRDLLRVVRNKLNHYRELPKEIQGILGPIPEGFDEYFTSRFPRLLIEVYKVLYRFCREEKCFLKYFGGVSL
ncbi:hypothetical protein Nepgr_026989 [Nepenthes gracilis]|uniref:non-specific serine/threonine protein kinase n=1 Tax=Nepenthes gracilis TaxID=150966 RepID=A0AAD3TAT4_NEPGR|nr:hypothetical protein Nepgr_026989 [Nepenthes gracilis]